MCTYIYIHIHIHIHIYRYTYHVVSDSESRTLQLLGFRVLLLRPFCSGKFQVRGCLGLGFRAFDLEVLGLGF